MIVRVRLDVSKTLRRGINLKMGSSGKYLWLDVKYEALPDFCFFCGCLGHTWKRCLIDEAPSNPHDSGFCYRNWLRGVPPNCCSGTFVVPGSSKCHGQSAQFSKLSFRNASNSSLHEKIALLGNND